VTFGPFYMCSHTKHAVCKSAVKLCLWNGSHLTLNFHGLWREWTVRNLSDFANITQHFSSQ